MADELGKIQILLEGIKGDIKAVAEGHLDLKRKIETEVGNLRNEFNGQFSNMRIAFNEMKSDLNEMKSDFNEMKSDFNEMKSDLNEQKEILKDIQHDLKTHIRQTAPPAHVAF